MIVDKLCTASRHALRLCGWQWSGKVNASWRLVRAAHFARTSSRMSVSEIRGATTKLARTDPRISLLSSVLHARLLLVEAIAL